jgi:hypothetical protein
MEQMKEHLLEKIDARIEANAKTMQEIMDVTHEKMDANTKK